jgi:hypothetical protein
MIFLLGYLDALNEVPCFFRTVRLLRVCMVQRNFLVILEDSIHYAFFWTSIFLGITLYISQYSMFWQIVLLAKTYIGTEEVVCIHMNAGLIIIFHGVVLVKENMHRVDNIHVMHVLTSYLIDGSRKLRLGCIGDQIMQGKRSPKQPTLIFMPNSLHALHIGMEGVH